MGIHTKLALTLVPFMCWFFILAVNNYKENKHKRGQPNKADVIFTLCLIVQVGIFLHWLWT